MKDFLTFLVNELTGNKEIDVEEKTEDSLQTYVIRAPKEVMGLLIGKEGRTIKAIRKLAFAKAIIEQIQINVTIEEKS